MKPSILAGIAFVFFSIEACAEAVPFLQEKTYRLPSGKRVATVFGERWCRPGECGVADSGVWGVDGGIPRFITAVFRIDIDGRAFSIPEKFYKDLTNTYFLDVLEQNGKVVVELRGGEAAGAYTAHFILGGMCGFERRVCGEACSEIWEQTTWHNSFAYDLELECRSGIK